MTNEVREAYLARNRAILDTITARETEREAWLRYMQAKGLADKLQQDAYDACQAYGEANAREAANERKL